MHVERQARVRAQAPSGSAGPKLMLGTKCPSMTSRCSQSAPAASTASTSSREAGEVGGEQAGRDDERPARGYGHGAVLAMPVRVDTRRSDGPTHHGPDFISRAAKNPSMPPRSGQVRDACATRRPRSRLGQVRQFAGAERPAHQPGACPAARARARAFLRLQRADGIDQPAARPQHGGRRRPAAGPARRRGRRHRAGASDAARRDGGGWCRWRCTARPAAPRRTARRAATAAASACDQRRRPGRSRRRFSRSRASRAGIALDGHDVAPRPPRAARSCRRGRRRDRRSARPAAARAGAPGSAAAASCTQNAPSAKPVKRRHAGAGRVAHASRWAAPSRPRALPRRAAA